MHMRKKIIPALMRISDRGMQLPICVRFALIIYLCLLLLFANIFKPKTFVLTLLFYLHFRFSLILHWRARLDC
jgi:hypothetical protein